MRSPSDNARILLAACVAVLLVLVAVKSLGCSGLEVRANVPMVERVMRASPKDRVLWNRACLRREGGDCKEWDVTEGSMEDAGFRASLVSMEFVCNIAGQRWKICPDKPGFCQYTYRKAWLLARKKLEVKYLPADPWKFHLDANTRCMNEDHNPFEEP